MIASGVVGDGNESIIINDVLCPVNKYVPWSRCISTTTVCIVD